MEGGVWTRNSTRKKPTVFTLARVKPPSPSARSQVKRLNQPGGVTETVRHNIYSAIMKGKACLCPGRGKCLAACQHGYSSPPLPKHMTAKLCKINRGKNSLALWLINQTCLKCIRRQGCVTVGGNGGGMCERGFGMCEFIPITGWKNQILNLSTEFSRWLMIALKII